MFLSFGCAPTLQTGTKTTTITKKDGTVTETLQEGIVPDAVSPNEVAVQTACFKFMDAEQDREFKLQSKMTSSDLKDYYITRDALNSVLRAAGIQTGFEVCRNPTNFFDYMLADSAARYGFYTHATTELRRLAVGTIPYISLAKIVSDLADAAGDKFGDGSIQVKGTGNHVNVRDIKLHKQDNDRIVNGGQILEDNQSQEGQEFTNTPSKNDETKTDFF